LQKIAVLKGLLDGDFLIEEFNPQLKYIPGHKNIVADTLSHLEIDDVFNPATSSDELFGLS